MKNGRKTESYMHLRLWLTERDGVVKLVYVNLRNFY